MAELASDDAPARAPAGGEPFDLPGGPDAVLLLHGLTGSPYELRPVADRLHTAGARCLGPIMPGHGGDPRALLGLPWRAWVDGAHRELQSLRGARRVLVVGCSMGALVACALAAEAPERVTGLALLAPALRLAAAARLAGLLGALGPIRRRWPLVPKLGGSDVRDPVERYANPTMKAVPLEAVRELVQLGRHVDALLERIRVPALVVAARHDHTVRVSGARRLARRLGGGARLVLLERSFHLVGIDVERDEVASQVAAFYESLPAPAGAEG